MPSFNQVTLIGHLTRDPELRYLPNQTAVADFGLAVNHKYRTQAGEAREEVLFIDCSCFGKRAEALAQYTGKGDPLFVVGRLRYETWEDSKTGGKRSKHTIAVNDFQFLRGKDASAGDDIDQRQAPARQQRSPGTRPPSTASVGKAEMPYGDEEQFKDDDIPFSAPTA